MAADRLAERVDNERCADGLGLEQAGVVIVLSTM
jgi:hypothetical protein